MKKYLSSLLLFFASTFACATPIPAACDGVTNDTATINASIGLASSVGGGALTLPVGTCLAGNIANLPGVRLIGMGPTATIILSTGTGNGITTTSAINSSTYVHTSIENLQVKNTNPTNTGAGIADTGGAFVNISDVVIQGFEKGVVLNQTELATIRRVRFDTQLGVGLWITNGPDYSPGALGGYTNRITVRESHFTGHVVCVADDGGIAHTYIDNNFAGCSTSIRLANQTLTRIQSNEFEGSTSDPILIAATSYTGLPLPGSLVINIWDIQASVPLTHNLVRVEAPVKSISVSNLIGSNSLAPMIDLGTNLVTSFSHFGNYNDTAGLEYVGTSIIEFSMEKLPWTPTDGSGAGLLFTQAAGSCLKQGKSMQCSARVTYPPTPSTADAIIVAPLPAGVAGHPEYNATGTVISAGGATRVSIDRGSNNLYLYPPTGNNPASNASMSGQVADISITYQTP